MKYFKLLRILQGHNGVIRCVKFSPDNNKIVSSSDDTLIKIWDIELGKSIQTFKGHNDYVRAAEFSPDGNTIISCSDDKTIRLWN
ncbi:WD-40 repeat protein, partial [Reticulomyxa filosa]